METAITWLSHFLVFCHLWILREPAYRLVRGVSAVVWSICLTVVLGIFCGVFGWFGYQLQQYKRFYNKKTYGVPSPLFDGVLAAIAVFLVGAHYVL